MTSSCSGDLVPSFDRQDAARVSLEGLALGDAFGQQFFSPAVWDFCLRGKELPLPVWHYTDDTVMALSIVDVLTQHERIDQDALAAAFVARYLAEPNRGYGAGAKRLLRELSEGGDWRTLSRASFGGEGSLGNGAAMRVAPLGAYFSDDWDKIVIQAKLSAEVTHAHEEGIAGAIAVALAAAWARRWRAEGQSQSPADMLNFVASRTPSSATRNGILRAADLSLDCWEHTAANALGNGDQITAADTVPFCVWCAAAHLDDFSEAMWAAVRVRGDIDTNCAIIGGIVAPACGQEGLPDEWLRRRESPRQSLSK